MRQADPKPSRNTNVARHPALHLLGTAIHHMNFEAALTRMRQMLRPGGTLVVVGLAARRPRRSGQ